MRKENVPGALSVVLVCLFPCILIYFKNADEAKLADVFSVMVVFMLSAIVIFLITLAIFRVFSKAVIMTNALMIFLCNFELLADIFILASNKYYVLSIVGGVLFVGIGIFLWRMDDSFIVDVNKIFCTVIAGLIIFNAIMAAPTIVHKMNATVQKKQDFDVLLSEYEESNENPNIYYIILDEYGGIENLRQLLGFDNSEFLEGLHNLGFNVSETSYNWESISTYTVVPNLLNLDYVVDDSMGVTEELKYMESPDIYKLMQMLGYEINTCSNPDFLDNQSSKNSFQSASYFENKAGYFALKKSVFIHLYEKWEAIGGNSEKKLSHREGMIQGMEYYRSMPDMIATEEKPQFNLAYFQTPHFPFMYREDGTPITEPEEQSVWNAESYLTYLKWTNGKMSEIVKYIVEKDPKAIVILQSDHGARYIMHMQEQGKEVDESKAIYQHNILNCVYYKGEVFNIEGLNGINTLRKVLNTQFGLDMKMLELTKEETE